MGIVPIDDECGTGFQIEMEEPLTIEGGNTCNYLAYVNCKRNMSTITFIDYKSD